MEQPDPDRVAVYRAMWPEQRVQAGLVATELVRERLGAFFLERSPALSPAELECLALPGPGSLAEAGNLLPGLRRRPHSCSLSASCLPSPIR